MQFRGASAEAAAALTDQLGGVAEATAGAAAGDLFSLAQSLRAEGALRRFVTDQTTPEQARTGLVREVFGGKVDATALDLLATAVARRWTRTRDLADALEHLSVVAAVRSVGGEGDRLVAELFTVRQAVNAHAELRNALSDPTRPTADKESLVDDLVGGKALPATVALTKQALGGSYRTVTAALEDYEKTAADVLGERVATVYVARELSADAEQRLVGALSRQYDRPVHLNVVVDPALVGGIRVEIGDDVIDGTISSRLEDARRKIAG
ncbi:F0F1 ATP synthase subunit delta [Nocardioides sp. GY 10113]|uniref:F0F1 ATP synthase subunit delta n=1 Tax=Nocardioides sp. GY 10113 TaxID=2569761 RepID=UPI0010A7E5B4|nr:F0F1 ATP synthase subunit delta [Nocardioides sp. GY 10113]TIC88767.1 F0F1 ATP synthase subunit delta [Nocardioides sp. GY 10113]